MTKEETRSDEARKNEMPNLPYRLLHPCSIFPSLPTNSEDGLLIKSSQVQSPKMCDSGPLPTPSIVDDKTPHIIPFLLPLLHQHHTTCPGFRPFILGLNGAQGVGKTTLVNTLAHTLRQEYDLETLVLSIDDFYLPHEEQIALAEAHRDNPLVQHRGEPGTHDVPLLREVFRALVEGREVRIPAYDKTAFAGQGDRVDFSKWRTINGPSQPPVQCVVLEGWCVGFGALVNEEIMRMIESSRNCGKGTLQNHRLEDLVFVNEKLKAYEETWNLFDAFVHLDAGELKWVYEWREEAEEAVSRQRGDEFGMTRDQVEKFVDGYMPAYELYTNGLRDGTFGRRDNNSADAKETQLRLVVGRDREVKEILKL